MDNDLKPILHEIIADLESLTIQAGMAADDREDRQLAKDVQKIKYGKRYASLRKRVDALP